MHSVSSGSKVNFEEGEYSPVFHPLKSPPAHRRNRRSQRDHFFYSQSTQQHNPEFSLHPFARIPSWSRKEHFFMTHRDPTLNALLHGGAAQTLFIPGEDPADFSRLLDDTYALYQPANPQHSSLVYDAAHARWYLNRRIRVAASFELQLHQLKPDIAAWTPADLHQLNLFDRYKTQAERAFRRALTAVQAIHTQAAREDHWRAQLDLQKQHIHLQRQKFECAQAKETTPAAPTTEDDLSQNLQDFQAALTALQHDAPLNCSVIVQRAFISVQDGATCIDQMSPANDQVRKLIEKGEQFPHPPQLVVRHFTFLNEIPEEYAHLLPPISQRLPTGRSFFRIELDFDKFLDLAAQEDVALDTDQTTVSDEDWLAAQRNQRK
jgi:hypothetical protein